MKWYQKKINLNPLSWGKQKAHVSFQLSLGGFASPDMTTFKKMKAYGELGWLYSAINAVVDETAAIELSLFQLKNGEMEPVESHVMLDLLFRVNAFQSHREFLKLHQIYKETAGESFWFLERGTNNPKPTDEIKEMWQLRPDLVDIVPDKDNFIKGYVYRAGAGQVLRFLPHEVIHFKYPNPTDPYRGLSPLGAAALAVDTDTFASKWNRNFYFNSARPDAVIEAAEELSDEQFKRLQTEWDSAIGGLDNAHRTRLLEKGLKYKIVNPSQKDMDFFNQRKMSRDEIMGVWRVPKSKVGITDDVNRANAEETSKVFTKDVIKPKMQDLVDTLNEFLVPFFGDNLILDFEDPVADDREKTIEEYKAGHNKWLTINEIRQAEGMEPMDGGDVLYQAINLFPVGESGTDSEQRMIKLTAPKAKDLKLMKRKARLKYNLLARNKRVKKREELRRKIQLMFDTKKAEAEKKDDPTSAEKNEVKLLNDNAKLKVEVDFLKAGEKEKDAEIKTLEKKKVDAEALAEEALKLNENGKSKGSDN